MYKVKQSVLDLIMNIPARRRIGEKLGIGDQALYNHLSNNAPDGSLTKMKALVAISEETGVPVTDILEKAEAADSVAA